MFSLTQLNGNSNSWRKSPWYTVNGTYITVTVNGDTHIQDSRLSLSLCLCMCAVCPLQGTVCMCYTYMSGCMCVCTFVSEQLCVSECVVPNLRCVGVVLRHLLRTWAFTGAYICVCVYVCGKLCYTILKIKPDESYSRMCTKVRYPALATLLRPVQNINLSNWYVF